MGKRASGRSQTILQDIEKTLLGRLHADEGARSKIPLLFGEGKFPHTAAISSSGQSSFSLNYP